MPGPPRIERTSVVNDVIRDYPSTVSVFNFFGIDACCNGNATIAEAADSEMIEVSSLVSSLRNSAHRAMQHAG